MIGMQFDEMMCTEMRHLDRLIVFLSRNGMDPIRAADKVNKGVGKVVCAVHRGKLVAYEDVGEARSLIVKGMERIPVSVTPIRVKYEDGFEGFTYRTLMTVKKSDIAP